MAGYMPGFGSFPGFPWARLGVEWGLAGMEKLRAVSSEHLLGDRVVAPCSRGLWPWLRAVLDCG